MNFPVLIVAILISAVALMLLAMRDPKRLRSTRTRNPWAGFGKSPRWMLAVLATAPGIVLIGMDNVAGALIWLGAISLIGWLSAQLLAPIRSERE